MSRQTFSAPAWWPGLNFTLLAALFVVLWIAGGASRADAMGQAVVRGAAWLLLMTAVLFGKRPVTGQAGPVMLLFGAVVAVPLLQLIPLPPFVWQALPGRQLFVEAVASTGDPAPWRPLSIAPSATLNALSSLIVPATVLLLTAGFNMRERAMTIDLLLWVGVAVAIVGLLQLSGGYFDNFLINESAGEVSGSFANRNHFALLMAIACPVAVVWAFPGDGRRHVLRAPIALGLLILFLLMALASGSRAGLTLAAMAVVISALFARQSIRRGLRRAAGWKLYAFSFAIVVVIVGIIAISMSFDRAASITRVFNVHLDQDMRGRAFGTILAMIRDHFPVGTGMGSFDPVFRNYEPFELLKPTYFNHAHDDYLELLVDAGLLGAAVLIGALIWWGWASLRALRIGRDARDRHLLPQLGSSVILLVLIASALDYPARTPMVMALLALAAVWLSDEPSSVRRSALPRG